MEPRAREGGAPFCATTPRSAVVLRKVKLGGGAAAAEAGPVERCVEERAEEGGGATLGPAAGVAPLEEACCAASGWGEDGH